MLRLRDIMTADVVTVSPDHSIREAMELFTARHVSGAPVADGDAVVGVVSATDLLAFVASLPDVTVGEAGDDAAWREGPPTAGWEDEAEPSARYFSVLWEGVNLGEALAEVETPRRSALDERTVAEVMTRHPVHRMSPDTPVEAAAAYMRKADIHRLLVMDGERLVGIVSTMDIVKAVAGHRLTALRYIFGALGTNRRPPRGTARRNHGR